MTLRRRLGALEAKRRGSGPALTEEKIKALSEEDLDAHEDSLEAALEQGAGSFDDLYCVVSERTRRACEALFDALEAVRRGEARDPPDDDTIVRLERMATGDEEARQEFEKRNGYRIWRHYQK